MPFFDLFSILWAQSLSFIFALIEAVFTATFNF